MKTSKPYILMLEDDEDDRLITTSFFKDSDYKYGLKFLSNSEEVIAFLENCFHENLQLPCLIILDKNAPVHGGVGALKAIKSHHAFSIIPVVMISGSALPQEINESYRLGVSSFIIKPESSFRTAATIRNFLNYWFNSVELPDANVIEMMVS